MDLPAEGPLAPPAACRLLDHTFPDIAANLALDEALLVAAEEQDAGPVLRFWEPTTFAVVLGASCRIRDDVDVAACRADGVALARRSSGGGTVLIGPGALNLTVVLPLDAAPEFRAVDSAQLSVLGRVARALGRIGPPVEVQGHGDLTLNGRKFAGSAQRRLRRYFLVHASVLYRFPIGRVARYVLPPRRQPAYRAGRPHETFLSNLDLPRDDLLAAIRSAWLPSGVAPAAPEVPGGIVDRLVRDKFADPGWVERL